MHYQGQHTYHPFHTTYLVNSWYRINLDTVSSHRSLCNGYRIAYTCWIRDLLLLIHLVSTCQISMLTFTTRLYTIYYCGWWCRGSTHPQIWWQGQTVCKTSWESWPAYGMRTYMDRESTEATGAAIREFLHADHWIIHPKSWEHDNIHIICCKTYNQASGSTPMNWLTDIPWMTVATSHIYRTIVPVHLWRTIHIWHVPTYQRTCTQKAVLHHQDPFQPFHNDTFRYYYIWLYKLSIQHHLILHLHFIMNGTDYWPLTREYLIWNAVVRALQFWTADFEAHVLSSATEQVYNTFFYTTSMHLLCQQSEEVLFSCFVTTLNAAFESRLALEDIG